MTAGFLPRICDCRRRISLRCDLIIGNITSFGNAVFQKDGTGTDRTVRRMPDHLILEMTLDCLWDGGKSLSASSTPSLLLSSALRPPS